MLHKLHRFGVVQVLLGIVGVVGIAAVAVPKYQEFVVRSRMSEAFSIVTDTRNRLTEFYVMERRFPQTETEIDALGTAGVSPPEFVYKVEVKGPGAQHDVVIQVYFEPDAIPGDGFNEQYVYVGANSGAREGAMLEWSCGLRGIEEKYMPSRCLY